MQRVRRQSGFNDYCCFSRRHSKPTTIVQCIQECRCNRWLALSYCIIGYNCVFLDFRAHQEGELVLFYAIGEYKTQQSKPSLIERGFVCFFVCFCSLFFPQCSPPPAYPPARSVVTVLEDRPFYHAPANSRAGGRISLIARCSRPAHT